MSADTATSPTTGAERRGRGRPRQFDADEVLDRVMSVFWTQGYEATSMGDIVEATGLNKSSLYNAFGSKEDLFDQALDRYVDARMAMMRELFSSGSGGLDDLDAVLDLLRAEMDGEIGRHGCMAVTMSNERGPTDPTVVRVFDRFRAEMRGAYTALLDRAAAAREIDRDLVPSYVEILVVFTLGLSLLARSGAPRDEIDGQFAAIRDVVAGWRIRT